MQIDRYLFISALIDIDTLLGTKCNQYYVSADSQSILFL